MMGALGKPDALPTENPAVGAATASSSSARTSTTIFMLSAYLRPLGQGKA